MGDENHIIHLPVRVEIQENREADLELINKHTIEPVTLEDIFTFSGLCSNDRMDSHFTRMDPKTTLRNYVEDLKLGTALLEGHDTWKDPYGRSYNGEMIAAAGETDIYNAVRGHWYIIRDLELNGKNTNNAIRAIKAGIIRDMSVGFGGNDLHYRCGSCGNDLFDYYECPHIPGLEDEDGRISFAWIENARLREVSTVYKGSAPGAYIDKAREYVEQGGISQKNIAILERQYQVRFDNGKRSIFMPKIEGGRQDMNLLEQLRKALQDGTLEKRSVYDVLSGEGEKFRQPDDVQLRNELGDNATVEGVRQMKKEAEQGRTYVADLIDNAVQTRVKVQGDKFNADSYRNMLVRAADIDFIKDEINSYEELAKQRFTGGRQTQTPPLPGDGDDEDLVVSETYKGDGE